MAVPLEWQLRIQGAEEVKTKLAQINQQFQQGDLSATEYSKELRAVNRDARSLSATTSLNKNLFAAMHPNINATAKAMTSFGRAMRGALAVMNALNLSTLTQSVAMNNLKVKEAELAFELNQAERTLRDMEDAGLGGTFAAETLRNEITLLTEKSRLLKEEMANLATQDLLTKIIAIGTAIGTIGTFAFSALPQIKSLTASVRALGAANIAAGLGGGGLGGKLTKGNIAKAGGAAAGVGIFGLGLESSKANNPEASEQDKLLSLLEQVGGGALTGAVVGSVVPGIGTAIGGAAGAGVGLVAGLLTNYMDELTAFNDFLVNDFGEQFSLFFTQTIPIILGQSGTFISNFFTKQIPQWITIASQFLIQGFKEGWIGMITFTQDAINGALKAIEFFVNGIIGIMNGVIEGLNRIPGISIPKIALVDLPKADFSDIIGGLSSGGGGEQTVSLPQSSAASGGPAPPVINIVIEGNLLTENDFESRVNDTIKQALKESGF